MSGKREREKRREERIQAETNAAGEERRKRLLQLAGAAGLLVVVVVAVVIVISQGQESGGDADVEDVQLVAQELRGIPQQGLVIGDPKAEETLVEFADLQCPFCRDYAKKTIPGLLAGPVRRGEIKIDFRNYAIFGDESMAAGAAAIAAGMQNRGWNFIELFYRNQGTENTGYITDEFLTVIAKGAGVKDIARWNVDRRSRPALREVAHTTNQARALGFTGTPSFASPGIDGVLSPIPFSDYSVESVESALQHSN